MSTELAIEKALKDVQGTGFYEKFANLRDYLTPVYSHWAADFSYGNDHGPGHIQRVTERLDELLGPSPLEHLESPLELFLCMAAVQWHDVGMLESRKGHPAISGQWVKKLKGVDALLTEHERTIVAVAAQSHGSKCDIRANCSSLPDKLKIGQFSVRPKVIAALVRLADELDEDSRRAPEVAMAIMGDEMPADSKFYWTFCQRIVGVCPEVARRSITFNIQLKRKDLDSTVIVDGVSKPFVQAMLEKLRKIDIERELVNEFLPSQLQYQHVHLQFNGVSDWKALETAKEFVLTDSNSARSVVDQLIGSQGREQTNAISIPLGESSLTLARVPPFGSDAPPFVVDRYHQGQSFLITSTPITRAQWNEAVVILKGVESKIAMNIVGILQKLASAEQDDFPVTNVSWAECAAFCNALSLIQSRQPAYILEEGRLPVLDSISNGFRLPSFQLWEYAATCGGTNKWAGKAIPADWEEEAWFDRSSGPMPSGTKVSNDWGLFDMWGNVWEWCDTAPPKDRPTYRLVLGGGFANPPSKEIVRRRLFSNSSRKEDDLGFRVVLPSA